MVAETSGPRLLVLVGIGACCVPSKHDPAGELVLLLAMLSTVLLAETLA